MEREGGGHRSHMGAFLCHPSIPTSLSPPSIIPRPLMTSRPPPPPPCGPHHVPTYSGTPSPARSRSRRPTSRSNPGSSGALRTGKGKRWDMGWGRWGGGRRKELGGGERGVASPLTVGQRFDVCIALGVGAVGLSGVCRRERSDPHPLTGPPPPPSGPRCPYVPPPDSCDTPV